MKQISPFNLYTNLEIKKTPFEKMIKIGGGYRIWTGDQGFADPCLTTWLSRLIVFNFNGAAEGNRTPECRNHNPMR